MPQTPSSTFWKEKIRQARLRLLQMHYDAKVGHLGGNLSSLDAMMTIYHSIKSADDTFILSKGHAAGALYVTLWSLEILSDEELKTFHGSPTRLAGHPSPHFGEEIPFATGSLGHGLSLAAGMALGKKLQRQVGRVFCFTSDGEWQEGSTWEGLIFASHHQLTNLTVLVDLNGLQGFGTTAQVASMSDLSRKLKAFDVDIFEIEGHEPEALIQAVAQPSDRLKILLLKTVKGKGVSFMENKMEWHYLPLSLEQYQRALGELAES